MNRSEFFRCLVLSILVSAFLSPIFAEAEKPRRIGEHRRDVILETPHPYPAGSADASGPVWSDHYKFPGATYLVFEFERFHLAPGDWVEVRDPEGKQVHTYRGRGPGNKGGDFITKLIVGSEAIIDLYSRRAHNGHYGYRIERISRGYNDQESGSGLFAPEAICGADDKEDAICYETSHPDHYDRARAVAMIVMDGSELCTAWLSSCDNHVITNNHCTWDDSDFDTQGELDRMEFLFMYQDATCGGGSPAFEYSFMGGTWLENDRNLDYTLIQAPAGEDPAATYGWLTIDYRLPDIDEPIYIVGHPSGRPKELSLFSTHATDQDNPDGFCEVLSQNEPVCVGGTVPEIGYMCDTEGGNSGSPVLSGLTHKVVALHHCANCANRGVRIQNIWDMNQGGANPLPACSLNDEVGLVDLDQDAYSCSSTIGLQVRDGSLIGAGTVNVTVSSVAEPGGEVVVLTETAVDSGEFVGSIDATVAPAAADGLLSVADGDTVTVVYIDADDGQGGVNIPVQDAAPVDCAGPVISNVAAIVSGATTAATWDTDEPADSVAFFGTSPPAWTMASDTALVTSHGLDLPGLIDCTGYFFWVQSTDAAGNVSIDDNGGAYYQFSTLAAAGNTIPANDTPLAIVDTASVISTVAVTDVETVVDVNVTLDITHTYTGDLDIFLKAPNGVEIELVSDVGGTGEDFTGTTFDDQAPTSITTGTPPFSGTFQPEGLLSTFNGIDAQGTWELRVFDDAGGDIGTLNSWSLDLSYPPRSCDPEGSFSSIATLADACSAGGPGDADGVWDSGEIIDLSVALQNSGAGTLTGLQATVSPLTAGVIMLDGTATFSDLGSGATGTSQAPHFQAQLPLGLGCGDSLSFQVDIVANEGSWSDTFQQTVGFDSSSVMVAFSENFDAGIPGAWTIVDGGNSTDTWFADNAGDPQGCGNTDPAPPIGGSWAAVDSDCAASVDMDESLITPLIDLSLALTATLEFDHYFNQFGPEIADVEVRSSLTGGAWVNLGQWTVDTLNPEHETIDITAQAAGAADVQVRWHYYNANFEWYWYVDNVVISKSVPTVCTQNSCASGGNPPGESANAYFGDATFFSWDVDAQATAGYSVYRGTGSSVQALTDSSVDTCTAYVAGTSGDNFANMADVPAAGEIYWYLVTGENAFGQGSAGTGASGLRILNSSGACP